MNADDIESFLRERIAGHKVPGASLALAKGERLLQASAGVLNLHTGVPVNTESVFQIGSITKVITTTLVMMLADRGQLKLDEPVVKYLPGFRLRRGEPYSRITTRHLLTHTSGIDGDFFLDTGRGKGALAKYVRQCRSLQMIHPPGKHFSYCNTGFVIAGRLIEVLSGRSWDQVVSEWLFEPLHLTHSATLAEHLVGKSAAIGHIPAEDDGTTFEPLSNAYAIPFSIGPAGSTVTMSALDLLTFARMHENEGRAPDGRQILRPESVVAMQQPSVKLPGFTSWGRECWGLGWSTSHWGENRCIGHDGNTDGQRAFLLMLPDLRAAMVLLTNGGAGIDLAHEVYDELFAGFAALTPRNRPPHAVIDDLDLSPYTGFYRHSPGYSKVFLQGRELRMQSFEEPGSVPESFSLRAIGESTFLCDRPPNASPWYVQFPDLDEDGKATCMFSLYRRCPRVNFADLQAAEMS